MIKEKITIAALRLFWLRGYKYVSLIDVASELGITKGAIYHYFSGKEELLQAAVHYLFDRVEAQYGNLLGSEKNLMQTLRAIVVDRELECYTQQLLGVSAGDYRVNHINFVLETMQNFPDMHKRIEQSHTHIHDLLEKKIAGAQASGEIGAGFDSRTLATVIFAILNGQHALASFIETLDTRESIMDTIGKMLGSPAVADSPDSSSRSLAENFAKQ